MAKSIRMLDDSDDVSQIYEVRRNPRIARLTNSLLVIRSFPAISATNFLVSGCSLKTTRSLSVRGRPRLRFFSFAIGYFEAAINIYVCNENKMNILAII